MAVRASSVVARPLRALLGGGVVGGISDGQLLDRFADGPGEAAELAFEALVERHGPMVLRVCRRALDDPNDAEDAFQATFLVLLRRAGSIRDRGSVASWLHGVAMRVAARAKVESARRRRIEARGVRPSFEWDTDAERGDCETLIHDELDRLPEKYRAPVVLCYLEGLTHEGAADQLGWPVGTVRGRLSRARDLLRTRLTRRGVTASAALAATDSLSDTARAAVSAALRDATTKAAVQVASGQAIAVVASAQVAAWVEGVSRLVALSYSKMAAGLLLLIGTLGTGLGLMIGGAHPSPRQPQAEPAPTPAVREANRREMLLLKGTWSRMATLQTTIGGVPQPPKDYKYLWSIDRDTITDNDDEGFAARTYRYSLDPDRTPKTIDLTTLNTGLTLRGIYKIEGDTLTVCEGLARPADFREGPTRVLHVFHRERRTPAQLTPEYANAPGCYWAIEPSGGVPSSKSISDGVHLIVKKDPQGAIVVILAYVAKSNRGEPDREYRPVAFDDKKTRYLLEPGEGGSTTFGPSTPFREILLAMQEYRLDPNILPFDRVERVGIESVSAEVLRVEADAASARAFAEARASRIELLPRPQVGKPYEFTLTAADGKVLRSDALKGKVVLIDCWASWSGPCTGKMPRLKTLYDSRRGDGFEVIGLNFDQDLGSGKRLVKAMALPWPQVFVPGDERTRRLWSEGPGFPSYPRLLLIDRQGILRWDGGSPEELDRRIAALLEAPRPGK